MAARRSRRSEVATRPQVAAESDGEGAATGAPSRFATAALLSLAFAAIATLIGCLLAVIMGSGIARPIKAMTVAMRKLADGDPEALGRRLAHALVETDRP